MNPGGLPAWLENNKVEALGVAAAAVVLLGLRARKKSTGAAPATSQPAGTLPAAAVVPANGLQATGSTYDSSAYDVYSALQSELTPFLQGQAAQTGASSGIAAVPPVASTLFAPTGSGNYVHYSNGTVAEVETDGSQLGLTSQQWNALLGTGARVTSEMPMKDPVGAYYETSQNLGAVKKPAGA